MNGMVFCRGCGESIHSTAPICPKCGAPQSIAVERGEWGNTMAWLIATAPLIGALAEILIEILLGYGGSMLFIVTVGINIYLCTLDESQLKERGIDTTILGNTWIVPIYLFKRVELLGEKPGYAILWCVLFLSQLLGAA